MERNNSWDCESPRKPDWGLALYPLCTGETVKVLELESDEMTGYLEAFSQVIVGGKSVELG